MRVKISINKKYEEMIVTLENSSNSELQIFSEILSNYSNQINNSIEFQTIHTPTQWTYFTLLIN